MHDRHSITEARRNLPKLIREAEDGGIVELTRRGNPVAVLVGQRQFERLKARRRGFAQAYDEFTAKEDLTELALDPDRLFAATRHETHGRAVRL